MDRASYFDSPLFKIPKPIKTTANKLSSMATIRFQDSDRLEGVERHCNIKLAEYYDSVTLVEFVENCKTIQELDETHARLGNFVNELNRFFRTNCHLVEELKKIRMKTSFAWQTLTNCDRIFELANRFYPNELDERRLMIGKVLREFEEELVVLKKLPEFIIHGDLSGKNILLKGDIPINEQRLHLIDFQDIQVGPQILELSTLILYCILEQKRIEFKDAIYTIPRNILKGYFDTNKPDAINHEIFLIPILMKIRLTLSLLNGLEAHEMDRENTYIMNTNQNGWDLLRLMSEISPSSLTKSWL